jgi:hypothetical protein
MPIDGNKTKVNTPKQLTENKKKDKRLKKLSRQQRIDSEKEL